MLTSDTNFNSVLQHRREPLFGLIGNTAMIPLRFPELGRTVYAKCEFVPPLLQGIKLDRVIKVSSQEALLMTKRLNREFGLLVGSSAGANVAAALQVAVDMEADCRIVTILCDRAERYFSTKLFSH